MMEWMRVENAIPSIFSDLILSIGIVYFLFHMLYAGVERKLILLIRGTFFLVVCITVSVYLLHYSNSDDYYEIEWVSTGERKPCGYIIVDQEAYYKEPAEYLVHVKGAEYPAFAMFFDGEFVPCRTDGVGGFADEIDYWAEIPKWRH